MTVKNRKEISKAMATTQTEITDLLKQIEERLKDCADPENNWATVNNAKRLRNGLRSLLAYTK